MIKQCTIYSMMHHSIWSKSLLQIQVLESRRKTRKNCFNCLAS